MSCDIPSSVFHGSVLSGFLRIARCTLLFKDLIPKAIELIQRMLTQGGDCHLILKQIYKVNKPHPEAFQNFIYLQTKSLKELTKLCNKSLSTPTRHIRGVRPPRMGQILLWVFQFPST